MKVKSHIIGMYVVTSDAPNATVYQVQEKHPTAPSYLLVYDTPRGKVTGGWADIGIIRPATPKQIAQAQG